MTRYDPDYVVPTSEVFKEWLEEFGLTTQVAAASRYRRGEAHEWATKVLDRVLAGRPVGPRSVAVLAAVTGISENFWRSFEHNYRTGLAAGKKVFP